MTSSGKYIIYFIIILSISYVGALKCWKCIAHDCEQAPDENTKASEKSCEDGQECMKVRYRMFDNITHYDSVIRTCAAGPCLATTQAEFQLCLATPKLYMISGCTLRTCCADRDLCNGGGYTSSALAFIVICCILTKSMECLSTGMHT